MKNTIETNRFPREFHAQINEQKVILSLLKNIHNPIMIDVGAHYGESSIMFAKEGFACFAFEPDHINRSILRKKIHNLPIKIDKRAVSNTTCFNKNFFRSPESTGISTLTPFRDTHEILCTVDTVTLDVFCKENRLNKIDFLKIDTEGYDLMVLLGVPWKKIKPTTILCEFEDNKTIPLGYNYHHIAKFLQHHGYTVFVSEWHPIIKYGISHDWHLFNKYPCELASKDAWGNLLAFINPPSAEELNYTVRQHTNFKSNNLIQKIYTRKYISHNDESNFIDNSQISSFKDLHIGDRCIIIGNGPSLNKMDLSFLDNEITFGLNRIYLLFDKWKFRPTYYASVNPLVLEQSADEILKISAPKFISHKGVPFFPNPPKDLMFIKSLSQWIFSTDPCVGLCEGWTVTYFAMQLAYYMGFREVILIGVDHHFTTQGSPNLEVTSTGPDPNHFSADYFGKGTRWHLPDLERSEKSYILAKNAFESANRRILDATVDGKLNIFPKIDYEKYFYKKNKSNQTLQYNDLAHPILEEISSLLNDAENFIQYGNLIEGIRILKTILIRDEFNIDALNDMAFAFYMDKNYLTALEFIKRAEHINKNDNNTIHNKREILKALSLHK